MARTLSPNASSVGAADVFDGYFTKALYLRSKSTSEIERLLGYGGGRLSLGWWLLFALERPAPANFEYAGLTHFSDGRIGDPRLGDARPRAEDDLKTLMGGPAAVERSKVSHIAALQLTGSDRLSKVLPVAPGSDFPAGAGIYQCKIPKGIRCKVAAFIGPSATYQGLYT